MVPGAMRGSHVTFTYTTRTRTQKHGAGHLRGSRLSSLFKHFLGGIDKAQKRNLSIVSNINIIIVIFIIIIIMVMMW